MKRNTIALRERSSLAAGRSPSTAKTESSKGHSCRGARACGDGSSEPAHDGEANARPDRLHFMRRVGAKGDQLPGGWRDVQRQLLAVDFAEEAERAAVVVVVDEDDDRNGAPIRSAAIAIGVTHEKITFAISEELRLFRFAQRHAEVRCG